MVFLPIRKNNDSCYPSAFSDMDNGAHGEIGRLFEVVFPRWNWEPQISSSQAWLPAMDVYDSKDNIIVKVDLPGFAKEDIQVAVQDDVLTIKGERKYREKINEENSRQLERYYGSFQRAVHLPAGIDPAKVQAMFTDGVLELTLGKKEEAKYKQIKIDIK